MFESSVNSEGIETAINEGNMLSRFESSVNSEGIETEQTGTVTSTKFESSVNSEGIETKVKSVGIKVCLRAV